MSINLTSVSFLKRNVCNCALHLLNKLPHAMYPRSNFMVDIDKSTRELFKIINHLYNSPSCWLAAWDGKSSVVKQSTARHFDLWLWFVFLFRHSRSWRSLDTSMMFGEYSTNFKITKGASTPFICLTLPWLFLWYFRNTFTYFTGI